MLLALGEKQRLKRSTKNVIGMNLNVLLPKKTYFVVISFAYKKLAREQTH
jgi:hypothetical protein